MSPADTGAPAGAASAPPSGDEVKCYPLYRFTVVYNGRERQVVAHDYEADGEGVHLWDRPSDDESALILGFFPSPAAIFRDATEPPVDESRADLIRRSDVLALIDELLSRHRDPLVLSDVGDRMRAKILELHAVVNEA